MRELHIAQSAVEHAHISFGSLGPQLMWLASQSTAFTPRATDSQMYTLTANPEGEVASP